jgi:hypothetical protein
MKTHPFPICRCLALLASFLLPLTGARAQEVPEDLIDDEHVQEEFGINHFTTPSIKKLFEDLDDLGTLPYDKLRRDIPEGVPRDRAVIALSLGTLIADGFLIVQAEKVSELEDIGKAVLRQAKVLGAGTRVTAHTKSILENSGLGEWAKLKEELAKTQKDVQAEMVTLRDVDIAHLVSLGGWLRALEIVAVTASDPYSAEKAAKVQRMDTILYFLESLNGLEPKLQENPNIIKTVEIVNRILEAVESTQDKAVDEATLQILIAKAREFRAIVEEGEKK